jgi:hypothetical protein
LIGDGGVVRCDGSEAAEFELAVERGGRVSYIYLVVRGDDHDGKVERKKGSIRIGYVRDGREGRGG